MNETAEFTRDYSVTDTDLGQLIRFPSGDSMFYVDSSHAYYRARLCDVCGDGLLPGIEAAFCSGPCRGTGFIRSKRLPSVSSVVKPFNYDPTHLLRWAARMTCEGVAILAAEGLSQDSSEDMRECLAFLHSGEGIQNALQDAELRHTDHRDQAGSVGSEVHRYMEYLASDDPEKRTFDTVLFGEAAQGHMTSLRLWWEANQPEPLNTEQFVYSAEHRFAGRFDLRALLPERQDAVALIDLKTGWVGPSAHAQLQGYELAGSECLGDGDLEIERFGDPFSDERFILKTHEDGSIATEIPCKITQEEFLAGLTTYRAAVRC